MKRNLSFFDKLIVNADQALRTLAPSAATAFRENPANGKSCEALSDTQKTHTAGLMRINHTGEVCAQALYQGQALTAKLPTVRKEMEKAAEEEIDHLVWCEERLKQLDSRTSYLNPIFYAASFSIGAAAGLLGDKWSLGFVAATEDRVCDHLSQHLEEISESDQQSRAILEQMYIDETDHGTKALAAGGHEFSGTTKKVMATAAKLMTKTTYYI
jgi:ubiquinone biosynthesis monooxygenase Coq7